MHSATLPMSDLMAPSVGLRRGRISADLASRRTWNIAAFFLMVLLSLTYIVQVNVSTSKGYALRHAEDQVEALKMETMGLEERISIARSMQSTAARAEELGMVAPASVEYLNVRPGVYALAK